MSIKTLKRLLIIICVILSLASCTDEKKTEKYTDSPYYDGQECAFNLRYSAGTGFTWQVIYTSDNVEIIKEEFNSNIQNKNKHITGGSGTYHLECRVTDGEEAAVIVKYWRPWEHTGDYQCYRIRLKDGVINEITEEILSITDQELIETDTDNGSFSLVKRSDWDHEEFIEEDKVGFLLKPSGQDRYIRIYYTEDLPDFVTDRTITIAEVSLPVSGNTIYCPNGLVCDFMDADWIEEYKLELMELVDMTLANGYEKTGS